MSQLRKARLDAKLSQERLAALSGVSVQTIQYIERSHAPSSPRDESSQIATSLVTMLKLITGLKDLPPGDYTVDEFLSDQTAFTRGEVEAGFDTGLSKTKRQRGTAV